MRRRHEGPSGSQAEGEDMERMPDSTGGATGATSAGMQQTGTYQQPGSQQSQATSSYGQATAPGRPTEYGTTGDGEPTISRPGAALSVLAGALAFLAGLAFVIRAHYYHTTVGYAYRWTLHGWGWVLLVLGALLLAGGVSNFLGIRGSRQFAAAMAVLTAVVAFLTIFYSPVWGIVVVAACAFAAYSLLRGGGDTAGYDGGGEEYGDTGRRSEREQAMSQGKRSRV